MRKIICHKREPPENIIINHEKSVTCNRLPGSPSKVRSCKLYNNKYMIASTQITKTEIFAFVAVPVFKLLARKVLLIKRKTTETVTKGSLLRK